MKKWIVVQIFIFTVLAGWWYASNYWRVTPNWRQPKFSTITRGDIRVPITASGLIRPNQEIEIKPEASGAVREVKVVEGRFVTQGETLVVLDDEDEERSVQRATADLARAQAALAQADLAIARANAQIITAEARIKETQADLRMRRKELDRVTGLGLASTSEQERVNAQSAVDVAEAQVTTAEQNLVLQEISLSDARESRKIQEAQLEIAKRTLEDAEKRLRECTIIAPETGIVTRVTVEKGAIVQSGTQAFTGGSSLMMLADVSTKKVVARVDEADYGRILDISPIDALPEMPGLRAAVEQDAENIQKRTGAVRISVDAFPGELFEGRIERVEPQGKLNTGSSIIQYDVHVVITDERSNRLPLGSQAQVEFTVESAENALRVPAEAVQTYQGQRGVWIRTENPANSTDKYGKRFVPCQFGITDGEFTELITASGDETLTENITVYTKLPPDDDRD